MNTLRNTFIAGRNAARTDGSASTTPKLDASILAVHIAAVRECIEFLSNDIGDHALAAQLDEYMAHKHGYLGHDEADPDGEGAWVRCTPLFLAKGGRCDDGPRRIVREEEKQSPEDAGHLHWVESPHGGSTVSTQTEKAI